MSVSTWDAIHTSGFGSTRTRQRRRAATPSALPAPAAGTAPITPASARRSATLREHASIILLGVAVAGLHTAVASRWESAEPVAPPAPQVEVELVKPKEIEPPKPAEPPKPLPQKLQPPPKHVPRAVAPRPQPAPTPVAPAPIAQTTDASAPVSVPPAPPAPVKAAEPVETVTPPLAYAAYLHNPPPAYPASAQRLGLEGKVLLRVRVLASGKPAAVELQQSSGRKILDEAALAAVQSWTFAPARRGQTPIEGWVTVPVEFKLERS